MSPQFNLTADAVDDATVRGLVNTGEATRAAGDVTAARACRLGGTAVVHALGGGGDSAVTGLGAALTGITEPPIAHFLPPHTTRAATLSLETLVDEEEEEQNNEI